MIQIKQINTDLIKLNQNDQRHLRSILYLTINLN